MQMSASWSKTTALFRDVSVDIWEILKLFFWIIAFIFSGPLEGLHLKFGTFDPISKDLIDPVEIDSGVYTVECIAEGSNPAPTVKLYLHNTEITDVVSDTNKMEGELLKYK